MLSVPAAAYDLGAMGALDHKPMLTLSLASVVLPVGWEEKDAVRSVDDLLVIRQFSQLRINTERPEYWIDRRIVAHHSTLFMPS
jgi:hypothetical protein